MIRSRLSVSDYLQLLTLNNMRNERLRHKKLAKKRAQIRDFRRRGNINKNVPTIVKEEKVEKYKTIGMKADGTAKLAHVGYRTVRTKVRQYRNHVDGDKSKPLHDDQDREIGMIAYPMSKKHRAKKVLQTANQ